MEIFKTPFSRAYWRCAVQDSKKLRTLVFSALMVAACVALSYLKSIPIADNIRVTWGFLARALCALVGGPVNALLFGFVEDTVSYFMNPDGGYNPFYIFTTMLGVFTYALFLYRSEVTVTRIFLAKLATNVQNVFLQSLGTYLWYSSKGYWAIVGVSAVKNAVMLPIQTVMLAALFAALLPVLHRMGFLPDQARRLKLWKRPGWLDRKQGQDDGRDTPGEDPWEN
ncbi:MAG: folate family ECF transporter S component [Oscillospiraceae bacterium]|nr:folate family ECF transporter S component [Oscillospiraceae bacterium]